MIKNRFRFIALILLPCLFFISCTTSIKTTWKNNEYQGEPFRKLMVMVVHEDEAFSRDFENSVAGFLRKKGTMAVAVSEMMHRDSIVKYQQFERTLYRENVEGILIFSLQGLDPEMNFIPGNVEYLPSYYYNYYAYYYNFQAMVNAPGYTRPDAPVVIESNIYTNQGDMLVWTGRTSKMKRSSVRESYAAAGKSTVKKIKRAGLVAAD